MSYFLGIFLILFSVLAGQAHALEPDDEDFAAVTWVLYNNRTDFKMAPYEIQSVFCSDKIFSQYALTSSFRIPSNKYFEVPMSAPLEKGEHETAAASPAFEGKIALALEQLRQQIKPKLVVNLNSHGGKGLLCQQGTPGISHEQLMKVLLRQIKKFEDETKRDVELWVFYSACHSASLIDEVKKQTQDSRGKFSNGGRLRFNRKIRVFASADADTLGYGGELWYSASHHTFPPAHEEKGGAVQMRRPTKASPTVDWKAFCITDQWNTHNYWSSFEPNLKHDALALLKNPREEEEIGEGLKLLKLVDEDLEPLLPDIVRVLRSEREDVVLEALKSLRYVGHPAQKAVPALLKSLSEVRTSNKITAEKGLTAIALAPDSTDSVVPHLVPVYKTGNTQDKLTTLRAFLLAKSLPDALFREFILDLDSFMLKSLALFRSEKFKDETLEERMALLELSKVLSEITDKFPKQIKTNAVAMYSEGNIENQERALAALTKLYRPSLTSEFLKSLAMRHSELEKSKQKMRLSDQEKLPVYETYSAIERWSKMILKENAGVFSNAVAILLSFDRIDDKNGTIARNTLASFFSSEDPQARLHALRDAALLLESGAFKSELSEELKKVSRTTVR